MQEDDLRKETDPRFVHLGDDLHVFVEVFCPASEAHSRMAHALIELRKFLVPDYNDEIRQQQLQELMYLNGDEAGNAAPPPPPAPGPPAGGPPARGRGRGRGLPPAPPAGRGSRGGALLATPPGRGGPSVRGPPGRGAPAPRARGAPAGRGLPPPARPAPVYDYDDGYGVYEDQGYYANTGETYRDSYDNAYTTAAG